jgi:transposase
VLGIDIAKRTFAVALLRDPTQPEKLRHKKALPNTPAGFAALQAWLARHVARPVHACLEATGPYGEPLATFLHRAGCTVSLVNPARIKGFAQSPLSRTKTDAVDALLIARFCAAVGPEPWAPPAAEVQELQALVRRLDALLETRTQEENRAEAGPLAPAVARSLQAHLAFLDGEIGALRQAIRDHIDRHPGLRQQRDLLVSIPGIGETTAAVLLGEIRAITAFASARQLAAYAGLVPREHVSGTSVRGKPRLAKTGNARLRKALYLPAIVAKRCNPLIRAFCEQLLARGKAPKSVIGAAMRKLLHLVYGVLKNHTPFMCTAHAPSS